MITDSLTINFEYIIYRNILLIKFTSFPLSNEYRGKLKYVVQNEKGDVYRIASVNTPSLHASNKSLYGPGIDTSRDNDACVGFYKTETEANEALDNFINIVKKFNSR